MRSGSSWRPKDLRSMDVTTSVQCNSRSALQIRGELIALASHHSGPEGSGGNHATDLKQNKGDSTPSPPPAYEKADSSNELGRLALWTELHERVENLPEPLRAAFDLVCYHELPQAEVAGLLDISVPTVTRRMADA